MEMKDVVESKTSTISKCGVVFIVVFRTIQVVLPRLFFADDAHHR